jgi:hypothetical protein
MENDFVSEITLECLMNRDQYAKYMGQTNHTKSTSNKKDKKFYRRRIYDITKLLLNNEPPAHLLKDVQSAFDNYVNVCVHYFKTLDKTDLIQEDYANIVDSIEMMDGIGCGEQIQDMNEANNLVMRSVAYTSPSSGTLDGFIKVNKKENEILEVIPQQKEFNLKDPVFKKKGICKKKNIVNN